ncbi:MAG: signal recognition particle-docking protein FtsY [Proteobacteria bacterium]|nr:signal recognition particle-docking protein FtsY [Pseudomonadota bacterium]
MSWLNKITAGLRKTSTSITSGVHKILTHRQLDQEMLDDLEELLITSDIGPHVANGFIKQLAKDKFAKDVTEQEVKDLLLSYIDTKLQVAAVPLDLNRGHQPQVMLLCGTNGSGKTTTAAKIAAQQQQAGKKVMLAACDTFRAAATQQLVTWAERIDCPVITDEEGADAASVAYRALVEARAQKSDLLIIDTAGRLHNKANLMEELAKISRTLKKLDETAPHEVVLVLDAAIGQNALIQAINFQEMIKVTGLIITKLDGTAKGGIAVAIADRLKLPIYYTGFGEGVEDLGPFLPHEFARAILS